jgi:hypothetical protein
MTMKSADETSLTRKQTLFQSEKISKRAEKPRRSAFDDPLTCDGLTHLERRRHIMGPNMLLLLLPTTLASQSQA